MTSDQEDAICAMSAVELARHYRSGDLSPVEVTKAVLARIERIDTDLNAFIDVHADSAMATARSAESQIRSGIDLGPLHGIPVSIKDLIRIEGSRTTGASRTLADAPPDREDAAVIERLKRGGAVILGKVNLREFALGTPDPDGPFREVQNPRRIGSQTGGSSSGSGAAVAAGLGPISLGTDTGGSVRYPASLCGIVALKPTNGLVSIRGVIPLCEQFDVVGPMARSVADVAATLEVIAGHDPADPWSHSGGQGNYPRALGSDVHGLRVGIPTNAFYRQGQREALALHAAAHERLRDLDLVLVPLDVPHPEQVYDTWDRIMSVDMAAIHDRLGLDETRYGRDFLNRLRSGRSVSAADHAKSVEVGANLKRDWLALFHQVDLLVLPGNWAGAAPYGVEMLEVDGKPYPSRLLYAPNNRIANIVGCPALALPVGATAGRMPIGIQLLAPPFAEARLVAVGHALEGALGNLVERWGIDPVRA